MTVNKIKLPDVIYLLPNEGMDGETVWCEHIPCDDHEQDAVKYIRSDRQDSTQLLETLREIAYHKGPYKNHKLMYTAFKKWALAALDKHMK